MKCGFQTSTVLVELNQNSNIEACLIDIKYAYIISVDTHFTYVFHDYLQLELIFFFFFSKIKDNNKQALLLRSISYINVPYINQQIFFFVYRSTCIFCLQSILWFLFNVFSLSPPRTFCNQVLLTHSLVLSSLQYRMVVENRKEPNKLKIKLYFVCSLQCFCNRYVMK